MADEKQAERGVLVTRKIGSQEFLDDGSTKGAAGGAPGRQESAEERHARIAEIAHRKAGARGFAPGGELEDWLAAEREVAARCAEPHAGDLEGGPRV